MLFALFNITITVIFTSFYTLFDIDVKGGIDMKIDLPKYYDYCRSIVKNFYQVYAI